MNIDVHLTAIRSVLPGLLLMVTCACGGGGGGSSSQPVAVPSTESFVMRDIVRVDRGSGCPAPSLGRATCITIRATAQVTFDGQPADSVEVRNGSRDYSVVFADGSVTSSTASGLLAASIDIQRIVVGTVEAIDSAHQRFAVLGQRICITPSTAIDGSTGTVADLAVGDRVGVSGFFSPDGRVVATWVGHESAGTGVVLRGVLLARQPNGFGIGQIDLDLTGAASDGFPGGAVAAGDPVLVFGEVSDGILVADSVQFIGGEWQILDGIRSAVRVGMVSRRLAPSEMQVEGRSVDCAYFPCEAAIDAQIGTIALLRQSGTGVGIETLAPGSSETTVVGPVDEVDVPNDALRVLGFAIQMLPATLVVDGTIDDIGVGDTVSVTGAAVGDVIVAGQIRTDAEGQWITTSAAAYEDPEIRVGGQTIATDAATSIYDDCGRSRDQLWLFDAAEKASVVQVRIDPEMDAGHLLASRVVADTDECPWDY